MENTENPNMHKKQPFTVPEHYFEHLTSQIMDRVEQTQSTPKVSITTVIKPYLGLVAIFAIAMILAQLVFWIAPQGSFQAPPSTTLQATANINKSEIELEEQFNPTQDEIVEYLMQEMSNEELTIAILERDEWQD